MQTSFNLSIIEPIIQNFVDPYLQKTWQELQFIKRIAFEAETLFVDIVLSYPAADLINDYSTILQQKFARLEIPISTQINITWQIKSYAVQPNVKSIPGVKNIIAVASGKGGVGKSTTAVNIALALFQAGARVGILDGDIYGPNLPQMLGESQQIKPENGQPLTPVVAHGIQSMSMAYLIPADTPMIWRGPMVSNALQQLAKDTAWDDLDYLIVDLPPGTGDIQLTLAQKIPVTAAIIVTTPQDVALLDARKGLAMFRKLNIPVLGVVENMSWHSCSQCGHEEAIFGLGGGERLVKDYQTELLGQLPLARKIRECADAGHPIIGTLPASDIAQSYRLISRKIVAKLSALPQNYAAKFPPIVVQ